MKKINTEVTIDKQTIEGLIQTVQNLYKADDIPWVIGYSGGKDSTAAVQLVWMALERLEPSDRKKTVHIINTDTLVESPVVAKWAKQSLDLMAAASALENQNLPIETHILTPKTEDTFWVNLLGKGYPYPRKRFRWCTDRMKIKPVNDFIKERIAEHGEIILVLGTRKAESASRAKSMIYYEKKRVRELLSPNPTLANELVFSPLSEWNDNDVWLFLMQHDNPWGYSNKNLLTLYKGASADGECPVMTEKGLPTCGKSRFGCWVCTMVEQDKSMHAMITNDEEKRWLTPLLEFRNEIGDAAQDWDRRDFRKMGGFLQGYHGKLSHGPYKKETRVDWLRRLLEVQKIINELAPEEYGYIELISHAELVEIRRIWLQEKHEFDDALPGIYEEITGNSFVDDDTFKVVSFQKEEWDILKETCHDKYSQEELVFEMVYSMIDIENRTSKLEKRKEILNKLEKAIIRNFYTNEEDAKDYYFSKTRRKEELGVEYNIQALEGIEDQENQVEDGIL